MTDSMVRKSILIVENEISPIRTVISALEKEFDVTIARTLADAVSKVSEKRKLEETQAFDLYLVDIDMTLSDAPSELRPHLDKLVVGPTNSGQAWTMWLRSEYPDALYIYLTSNFDFLEPELEPKNRKILHLAKFVDSTSPDKIVGTVNDMINDAETM